MCVGGGAVLNYAYPKLKHVIALTQTLFSVHDGKKPSVAHTTAAGGPTGDCNPVTTLQTNE